jgi:hypothetical protein
MSRCRKADVVALAAVITVLGAFVAAWRGNVLAALVAAVNGVTFAVVSLGFRLWTE